jgi:hypothetical protein
VSAKPNLFEFCRIAPQMRIANFLFYLRYHAGFFELQDNLIQFFLPEKKEYAKVAITLTGSKGQALRVFEKNLPFS